MGSQCNGRRNTDFVSFSQAQRKIEDTRPQMNVLMATKSGRRISACKTRAFVREGRLLVPQMLVMHETLKPRFNAQ